MKDERHSLPPHQHQYSYKHSSRLFLFKLFNSTVFYVLLLLLSYLLGYLSAVTRPIVQQLPTRPIVQQLPTRPIVQQLPSSQSSATTKAIFQSLPTQLDNLHVTTVCAKQLPSELVRETILDKVYDGTSPFINFPPAHVATLLRGKSIKGWGSNGAVFEHLVKKMKPKVIIEVGTFLGASALHMAQLTHKLGLDSVILCIDDFRGWPGFRDRFKFIKMVNGDVLLLYQFMQNVVAMNATETVLPVPFSSGSGLQKLCEWGVLGDMIEIDAGHDFNSAWADINRAYRILRPGGVIFGHDYFSAADNRGVRRAVNLFGQLNGLKIQTDGQHWVIYS
ncbi:hypothetical protein K2173_003330 [Erythroxylum novogranatense]|uniref:S-adenosyl-L-methionine-dependent methyltransferase n=1 Tax=Erythroxylum novogranatense TaxID=1862640 RepID=A0AAV8S8E2_9ROSI|nr:hypothetical protein K2173_003330 [Erythroxylum novogranatense]